MYWLWPKKTKNSEVFWHECTYDPYENPCQKIFPWLFTFSIWIYIENYCYLLILAKWKEPGSHFGMYTHITHMNIHAKNDFLGTFHLARINKKLFCNDEFIQWLWSNKNSLGYYLFWPRYSYGWYECRF